MYQKNRPHDTRPHDTLGNFRAFLGSFSDKLSRENRALPNNRSSGRKYASFERFS